MLNDSEQREASSTVLLSSSLSDLNKPFLPSFFPCSSRIERPKAAKTTFLRNIKYLSTSKTSYIRWPTQMNGRVLWLTRSLVDKMAPEPQMTYFPRVGGTLLHRWLLAVTGFLGGLSCEVLSGGVSLSSLWLNVCVPIIIGLPVSLSLVGLWQRS